MIALLGVVNFKEKPAREAWFFASLIAALSFVAICVIFREESVGAVRVWVGSQTYQHCFFILPISAYMIWRRRARLEGLRPQPEFRALFVIFLLTLPWMAASVLGVLEAQQFVVLTIIQAMLWAVLGWPVYRRLIAPFLYLYFLVPSGAFLVPPLQDFTARFAVLGLQALNIPVFSDGIIIEVPAGTFVVAEACAGVRFLIAALAFGVFYATEMYHSLKRRLVFIGLSIIVPIIANGFRALGLILIAQAFGNAAAVDADHVTFGWVFFSIVLLALIFIGRAFSDRDHGADSVPTNPSVPSKAYNKRKLLLAGLSSVALSGFVPATFLVLDSPNTPLALPAIPPSSTSPWQIVAAPDTDWSPRVLGAEAEFLDALSDGEDVVYRYLALYPPNGGGDNFIRSENRIADPDLWRPVRRDRAEVALDGALMPVNVTELVGRGQRLLVWSNYVIEGKSASDLWDVKWRQLRAYVLRDPCQAAFFAAATKMEDDGQEASAVLARYVSSMEPLDIYLCDGTTPKG